MKLVEAATLHQKSNDQHNEPVSSVGRNPPHDFPLDARNDSNGRLAAGSKAAAKKQAMSMIPPSKEGLMAYRVDNDLVSKVTLTMAFFIVNFCFRANRTETHSQLVKTYLTHSREMQFMLRAPAVS